MADEAPKSLPLHLAWIGTLCGSLLVLLGDVLPVRMNFVRPDTLFGCLLEVQIAFLLFVWPLFVPSIARGPRIPVEGVLLLISSLPLLLIAANVSNIAPGAFAAALLLLGALAAFPAAVLVLGERRRWKLGPWLLLGLFAAAALFPFLRFVAGPDWSWLSKASPFWAAGEGDYAWPALVYGLLSAAALAAARLLPARVS